MKIILRHTNQLPETVKLLLTLTGQKRLFAFYGPMGSGKTTIIKAICRELGAEDQASSPSFTIVNEYRTKGGDALYHIDFYRIKKQEEVFDFGIEEYFASGSYCFMEWPELVEEILPPETYKIRITVGEKDERILDVP
ncbi:MAG: tRNA ((37)-N6)-threonylcarbamoyltransferase complex ATPase subunit type 1 TsaE [Bacteroidetes bacterium]|jgi:tRNA threonylcarbamoyladenosine biosynthesis protein TsaE|nr:tRNA ((37)-N6)-threonylcarbamoyltransferase complex ATPase subunit type 1 TsaE [Bacteroidota bacterium]